MDKTKLKNTLRRQADAFKTDFQNKWEALQTGKNCFTDISVYVMPKQNNTNVSFADAFENNIGKKTFGTAPNIDTTIQAKVSESNPLISKIAALRGCSLPGDYLKKI